MVTRGKVGPVVGEMSKEMPCIGELLVLRHDLLVAIGDGPLDRELGQKNFDHLHRVLPHGTLEISAKRPKQPDSLLGGQGGVERRVHGLDHTGDDHEQGLFVFL